MANSYDELLAMFRKIVFENTRYNVPRLGQVSSNIDSEGRARVQVTIPSLGWDTPAKAAWCYPKDKKALVTPAVNDWVIVEFLDGDRDLPIYSGIATQMKDQLPASYSGETSQIIFESDDGTSVKYDETAKELIIQDTHGNTITMKSGEISITGTTIKLIGGTEAFVKGNTFDSWITATLLTVFNAHIHSGVTTGPGVSGPPGTPLTGPINHLSTTIKGE